MGTIANKSPTTSGWRKQTMKVIAIANHKGGVGKTTCALNIAVTLAIAGKRTLAVDLDFQGNLSLCNIEELIVVKLYTTTHDEKAEFIKDLILTVGYHRHLPGLFYHDGQAGGGR